MQRWIPEQAEGEALRALRAAYSSFQDELFAGRLRSAALAFTDARGCLGRWIPAHRTIELQRSFVCTAPWLETLEVLKHEMAHQFVDEVLNKGDEPPHGPSFQAVCEMFRIDGRASGRPQPPPSTSSAMRRIEKLLSLGQSPEVREAEAAMRKAQALLRTHNLDAFRAGQKRDLSFRQLGQPAFRIYEHDRWVATILMSHFFVEVIWLSAFLPGRRDWGSVLEVSGNPENLDIAEYVHSFLHRTAAELWERHRAESGASGRARWRYLKGVMMGFSDKLKASEKTQLNPEERALIRVGDPRLDRYLRARHPGMRMSSGRSSVVDEATAAGQAAGRNIILRRGVHGEGGDSGRRRALPRGQ